MVARALARAVGARDVEWSDVLGNADALGALAIDLAGDRWVVLDDLGAGTADDVAQLLRQIARYARQSKWIARALPRPPEGDLLDHIVPLGPMPDAEMRLLARSLMPGIAAGGVSEIVAAATGSPHRLRQLSREARQQRTRSPSRPRAAPCLLRTLALLSVPIPRPSSRASCPHRSRSSKLWSERAGSSGAATVCSCPSARAVAWQQGPSRIDARWPAQRSVLRRIRLQVEACACGSRQAGPTRLRVCSQRFGEELLATGYAARIQRLLEEALHAALDAWRLRVAADLGDTAVLERAPAVERVARSAVPVGTHTWCGKRRFDEAIAIAARVQAEARGSDPASRSRRRLLRAQAIGNRELDA